MIVCNDCNRSPGCLQAGHCQAALRSVRRRAVIDIILYGALASAAFGLAMISYLLGERF